MPVSHRERFRLAMNHEVTDRVPIAPPGFNPIAYRRLLDYLKIEQEHAKAEVGGGSGTAISGSEAVLQRFDMDVRDVSLGQPDRRGDEPAVVMLDEQEDSYRDQWGVIWRRSGPDSPYINVKGPLQDLVDPEPSAVDSIVWPHPEDPGRVRGLRKKLECLRETTDYAVILGISNAAFALAQRVRGFGELLEDLIINPAFADALLERVNSVICGYAAFGLREVGDLIDGVTFGDDMGTQREPYMSTKLYRARVKPHHRKLVETLRQHTEAKILMHSDGSIYALLPELIDCGIEGINPVQVSAAEMDPARLNREFGMDLCFWGGIDTQSVLPWGSPEDVAHEVRARIGDLGLGGGYLLSSVHKVQAEVPPENIVAMFDTARAVAVRAG